MDLYNAEHELKLISAVVYDPASLDEIQVQPEDLYDKRNIELLQAVQRLVAEGRKPELPLLGEHTAVDPAYLAKIEPVTAANIGYYAESVKRFARLRKLYRLVTTAGDKLKLDVEPDELEELLEKGLTELSLEGTGEIESLGQLMHGVVEQIEARYNSREELSGIPTGLERLDELTGGLQRGEFIVMGARPSIGKTALALTIARNAAVAKVPVGFFSLEQSQSPLRLLAGEARVNIQSLRSGLLAEKDFYFITDGATKLYDMPIYFDHRSSKLVDIRKNARKMVRHKAVEMVFIDYLTLIRHGLPSRSTAERVGEISHELKALAKELNVALVVLSQLKRDSEDRRPNLADLRWSGEIEQDADVVIFLHRDRKEQQGVTVVDVAKQRNGPIGDFRVKFVPEFLRFENVIWHEEEAGE